MVTSLLKKIYCISTDIQQCVMPDYEVVVADDIR